MARHCPHRLHVPGATVAARIVTASPPNACAQQTISPCSRRCFVQGSLLKKIVEAIRDLVNDANVDCAETGITMQVGSARAGAGPRPRARATLARTNAPPDLRASPRRARARS